MDSNILMVFCVLFHAFKGTVDASRITMENGLKTLLWTTNSYDNSIRPDDTVNVTITFFPMSLRYLDIADGSMGLVGFFTFSWRDSRLDWSSNPTYSTLPMIFTTGKNTWYPPLILFNSIEEIQILMDPNFQNPIRVINTGDCEYAVIDLLHTDCDTDSTYYPYDTQSCNVIIAPWGYSQHEIDFLKPKTSKSFYKENGEWDFTDCHAMLFSKSAGRRTVPSILYNLKFKRRTLFQSLNIVLPTMLLGFLVATAFKLPPDSGERMGYSLTTLLAYAVYLTLVSEHLPTVSLHISYISIYLIITLLTGSCVVFFSKVVLSCHHKREDEPVPQWLINLHEGWMGRLAGIHGTLPCCKSKDNHVVQVLTASEESTKPSCGKSQKEKEVTWPDITRFLDKFLFRVFMSLTCIQQVAFLIIFIYGYNSS